MSYDEVRTTRPNQNISPPEAIDRALEGFLRIGLAALGSASGDVALLSDDGTALVIRAAIGPLQDHLPVRIPRDAGISGRVLRRNATELVEDVPSDPGYRSLLADYPPGEFYGDYLRTVHKTVKTPLRIGNTVIGILCVHWGANAQVPAEACAMVENLAAEISEAVHNMAREAHAPWFDTVLLGEIPDGVQLSSARRKLYWALAREALRQTDAGWSNVRVYDTYRNTLRFVAWQGSGWTDEIVHRVYLGDERSAGGWAAAQNRQVVIDDVAQSAHYRELFPAVRSHVTIPITLRSRVVAVVSVDANRACAFTPVMIAALNRLAQESSFALDHLALVEDTWLWHFEKRLAIETDARQVCDLALRDAAKIFGVRGGSILLHDRFTERLRFAATMPTPTDGLEGLPDYAPGEGLTGWVFREGRVLRLRNTEDSDELRPYQPLPVHIEKWSEKIDYSSVSGCENSFLAAPLLVAGGILGVLRLTVKENGEEFTAEDEVLIRRFCNALALSLHNVRLRGVSAQATSRLEGLHRLSSKLAETLDTEQIAAIVLEDGLPIVGAVSGHIRLFDELTGNLKLVSASGPWKDQIPRFRGPGEGISGRVALSRGRLVIADVTKDQVALDVLREDSGLPQEEFLRSIASEACYPLLVKDELVGTLNVHWNRHGPHDPGLMRTLEIVVHRAALSLHSSLLFREADSELKRKLDWLVRLRMLAWNFATTRDASVLAEQLVENAEAAWGDGVVTLRRLNDSGDKWVVHRTVQQSGKREPSLAPELDANLRLLSEAARSVVPTRLFNTSESPAFQECIAAHEGTLYGEYLRSLRTVVIVPLRQADRCLGLLILTSPESRNIQDSTIDFLQILSGHAAVALQNADLLAEKEEQLSLAQPFAMLGAMLSGFQHTMRNGIQRISNCLQYLHHPKATDPEKSRYLDLMQTEVDSFFGVIREIELFAKGDKTKLREPVDLNQSVKKILQQSEQRFERGIEVRTDLSAEPPVTRGHYVELEQAFIMVVDNAVEAMLNGGVLTIQTAISGGDAVVRFTDTGIGMDETSRKRATDPFYTTKRDHGGTGMGLAVVLGVVTRHSGTFDIKSEPGKGTVIELRFKQEVVS